MKLHFLFQLDISQFSNYLILFFILAHYVHAFIYNDIVHQVFIFIIYLFIYLNLAGFTFHRNQPKIYKSIAKSQSMVFNSVQLLENVQNCVVTQTSEILVMAIKYIYI